MATRITGFEKVMKLIIAARPAELIYKTVPAGQHFRFDVRYGGVIWGIVTKTDALSVRQLVELARIEAPGFSKSMLSLATTRTTLAEFASESKKTTCVSWAYSRRKVSLVTLADWLDEQGETPSLE